MDKELKEILEVISKRVKTIETIMIVCFYASIVGGVVWFVIFLSAMMSK